MIKVSNYFIFSHNYGLYSICSTLRSNFFLRSYTAIITDTDLNKLTGLNSNVGKIPFHLCFTYRNVVGFIIILLILIILVLIKPYLLGDPDNFIFADPLITTPHIQPE
uniref:Cytochrome b n=1 Tax=Glossina morsitans morsitans TaxID=37546 RepID=A0A1B0FB90_GLOMM